MSKLKDIRQLHLHHPIDPLLKEGVFTYGRFEQNIKEAPTRKSLHRHDFHEIFILTQGAGTYTADFHDFSITKPCVALAPAGTCHQWQNLSNLQGHVISFDFDFLGPLDRRIDIRHRQTTLIRFDFAFALHNLGVDQHQ